MNWWAGAVIWKMVRGRIYFLVQNSRSLDRHRPDRVEIKFPGGTSQEIDNDPIDTLRRELKEEIFLRLIESKPEILCIIEKKFHTQYFYLVSIEGLRGRLRDFSVPDGDTQLGAPRWVRARTLQGKIYPSHERAYLTAVKRIKTLQPTLVV